MGNFNSKNEDKIKLEMVQPVTLEFTKYKENQLSGLIYHYFRPDADYKIEYNSFNNIIVFELYELEENNNFKKKFIEIHYKFDNLEKISTDTGKMYQIKEDLKVGSLIIKIDLQLSIKEVVYISK